MFVLVSAPAVPYIEKRRAARFGHRSDHLPGNSSEICGDANRLSIYSNGPPTQLTKPSVPSAIGSYSYVGCYTEASSGRALSSMATSGSSVDLDSCANFCKGYTYFGVEYADECYCGNALGAGSTSATETDCSMTCAHNSSEICGAGNRLTLYTLIGGVSLSSTSTTPVSTASSTSTPVSTLISSMTLPASSTSTSTLAPTPTGPVLKPAVGAYTFLGCYTESTNPNLRALGSGTYAYDTMTLETCAGNCTSYTYFGVEYGRECYCGNVIRGDSVLAAAQGDCNFVCPGKCASEEYWVQSIADV